MTLTGRTALADVLNEQTTHVLSATMLDENGTPIPASSAASCTLTLYETASETIINSRSATNILNTNGGSWDVNGLWKYTLTAADNAIINTAVAEETHTALITYTYSSNPVMTGRHLIVFRVRNLSKVT